MKMDDSVKSGGRLEVSVSFGRFENDALSWEKWSSFSPNKYLEEVGSLSTPGSVAQKKAYFEAHYKRIAARKAAEELEQEKSMDSVKPSADVSSDEDCNGNSSENGTESAGRSAEDVVGGASINALTNVGIVNEVKDDDARLSKGDEQGACTNGFVDFVNSDEEIEVSVESRSSAVEEAKDISTANVDISDPNVRKDERLVVLKTSQKDSKHMVKEPPERKNGIKQASVTKKENSKLNARNIASKVTPTKKERNVVATKKKAASSPAVKPLQASTPKYAKPTLISTPAPVSQSSKKKVNGSAPSRSKVGESKRAAPTSLHMSLSLGPLDSLGALSMTRKSLIMERMGDKDIVKRAFKTFQNRPNGSVTDDKQSTVKVSATAYEPKMSSYYTPTKGNEGLRTDAEKRATQRSQSGTRSNPLPSGLNRSSALDKKSKNFSPIAGLKSDEKAEKRKEFIKKLGAKSMAREAENARRSAKSKVGAENEIRQQPTLNQ